MEHVAEPLKNPQNGEKTFKRDLCQASFSYSGTLQDHLRTHNGEKTFKCDLCQASFSQSENWKNHLRIQSGEKQIKCHRCQASCQPRTLKNHLRIHSEKKKKRSNVKYVRQASISLKV